MSRIKLTEKDLINLVRRVTNEQAEATWDCENGKCVKVVGKGGVGEFATFQECEDSNCEERARPGGYGGRGDSMSAMDTQALNEIETCSATSDNCPHGTNCMKCSNCGKDSNGDYTVDLYDCVEREPYGGKTKTKGRGNAKARRYGPTEFDGGNVQTEAHLNRLIKRTLNETQLLLERPQCWKDGNDGPTSKGPNQSCDKGGEKLGTCVDRGGGGECCYLSTRMCHGGMSIGGGPGRGDDRMASDTIRMSENNIRRIVNRVMSEEKEGSMCLCPDNKRLKVDCQGEGCGPGDKSIKYSKEASKHIKREMGEGLGPSACPPVSCAKTQSPGCCEGKSQHPVTCRCVRTSSLKRKRPNNKGINKGNR